MNRKDRAINLGLKIKSLEGNFSVARSVINELKSEIELAVIDESDRSSLLELYNKVVEDLKSVVSPSVEVRNKINQLIEDANIKLKESSSYIEVDNVEGLIKNIEIEINDKTLKKEHKAALKTKLSRLEELYKKKVGTYLKKNFNMLTKEIKKDCSSENPYHVSVAIKALNKKVKMTPLFYDDRHELQALLDTNWQKASKDIKVMKEEEKK